MEISTVKKKIIKPYHAYSSLKRSICDYLGSLRVKKYLNSSKIIRTFKNDDLERILEIYENSFGNKNYNQILKYSKLFRNIFFIYEVDGIIVGYLGFYVHSKFVCTKRIQIATAFSGAVDRKMRGKGIFTLLYKESLLELKKNHVFAAYGYIDVDNINSLYIHQKLGFKIIEKVNNICGAKKCAKVELLFDEY